MSVEAHKKEAPDTVSCHVVTVSDTREEDSDKSGRFIQESLAAAGFQTVLYNIVPDERGAITAEVKKGLEHPDVDVILLNGGTGVARRDITIETVAPLYEKEIPGFGELFRMLSYTEDIGSAAILSRASAGTASGKALFCMPGSSGAVKLAVEKLIKPELPHIVRELKKDR
ncbi:MogA/MoaB family molybdenum cofactor biosynthesis protein [Alkalicoccus chagannorensis]|uniref:MogA/MoaB family molybdenum cofactor biosynthesis protein n=1 Tax=Alkalicoccus chagannorensis TaxID=427072 RepID=UPI0003FFF3E0|nr:molybdenum cofactor biosynthesis protein B [Alkalicoccus chagannorensis]